MSSLWHIFRPTNWQTNGWTNELTEVITIDHWVNSGSNKKANLSKNKYCLHWCFCKLLERKFKELCYLSICPPVNKYLKLDPWYLYLCLTKSQKESLIYFWDKNKIIPIQNQKSTLPSDTASSFKTQAAFSFMTFISNLYWKCKKMKSLKKDV